MSGHATADAPRVGQAGDTRRAPCGVLRDDQGKRLTCPKRHGSWYIVYNRPPDIHGRRRQTTKGGFATERAASQALHDALTLAWRGDYVEPVKPTVGEYLDQWLAAKAGLRSNTRRSYRGHLDRYLKPVLGHLKLADLRHLHVERLFAALPLVGQELDGEPPDELLRILAVRDPKLPPRPMGAASIRRVHATLMSALNTAVKKRILPANPAAHVELPAARRPKPVVWTPERIAVWQRTGARPSVAVWTPEQTGRFLDTAMSHR